MSNLRGQSGRTANLRPIIVAVHGFAPVPGKTPRWWRVCRPRWSHIALAIGEPIPMIWDQPFRGVGQCYHADSFISDKALPGRHAIVLVIEVDDHDPEALYTAFRQIEGRKGQPIRTILRYLHLWPRPAWNCASPVRIVLNALDIPVRGETPDALISELEGPSRLPPNLQAALGAHDGLGGDDGEGE